MYKAVSKWMQFGFVKRKMFVFTEHPVQFREWRVLILLTPLDFKHPIKALSWDQSTLKCTRCLLELADSGWVRSVQFALFPVRTLCNSPCSELRSVLVSFVNIWVKQFLTEMCLYLFPVKITCNSSISGGDFSSHSYMYLFPVYLTMLTLAGAIQCLMLRYERMTTWERYGCLKSWPNLRQYLKICLEVLRPIVTNLSPEFGVRSRISYGMSLLYLTLVTAGPSLLRRKSLFFCVNNR
jgi:hypothetical protein